MLTHRPSNHQHMREEDRINRKCHFLFLDRTRQQIFNLIRKIQMSFMFPRSPSTVPLALGKTGVTWSRYSDMIMRMH